MFPGFGHTPFTENFQELTNNKWNKRLHLSVPYFNEHVETMLSYTTTSLLVKAIEDNRGKLVKVSKDEHTGKKKVTGQKKELQQSEHHT